MVAGVFHQHVRDRTIGAGQNAAVDFDVRFWQRLQRGEIFVRGDGREAIGGLGPFVGVLLGGEPVEILADDFSVAGLKLQIERNRRATEG